jgi:Acyl-CoA dehydrogenase, C-terminal domain
MRFTVAPEHALFAESVAGAIDGWVPVLEPVFGSWWDERDGPLGERLAAAGWETLWEEGELLGPAVAGAIELGRALAPLSLVDEATLGAPLWVDGRVRHGAERGSVAVLLEGGSLGLAPIAGGEPEPTLDGTGTLRVAIGAAGPVADAAARLHVWGAVTLGYCAGLADAAVATALVHVTSREQFGAPLGALAAVQGRLADAALARDGLLLAAWAAADPEAGFPGDALAWAGNACREVAAEVLQVHGGIGFALEGGVHRFFRRAKTVQVWTDAVLAKRTSS